MTAALLIIFMILVTFSIIINWSLCDGEEEIIGMSIFSIIFITVTLILFFTAKEEGRITKEQQFKISLPEDYKSITNQIDRPDTALVFWRNDTLVVQTVN